MTEALALTAVALVLLFFLRSRAVAKKEDYFDQASKKFSIRASLLKAIAEVESGFNPRAQGRNGEVGMFQMKRAAFDDAKRFANLQGEFPTSLYDPATAAMFAAAYLAWIRTQGFRNDIDILRAYNQGPTGARRSQSAGRDYAERVLIAENKYV